MIRNTAKSFAPQHYPSTREPQSRIEAPETIDGSQRSRGRVCLSFPSCSCPRPLLFFPPGPVSCVHSLISSIDINGNIRFFLLWRKQYRVKANADRTTTLTNTTRVLRPNVPSPARRVNRRVVDLLNLVYQLRLIEMTVERDLLRVVRTILIAQLLVTQALTMFRWTWNGESQDECR